jgi:tRNA(Ile)-lysidine synthase
VSPRDPLIQPLFEPADPGLLLPAVRGFAQAEELFPPGARVLVAVSGGPDSVAMLHVLHRLGPAWGLHLGVAHFDHGLRGEASREDARFVADLARDLKLSIYTGEGDVRGLARARKISLQMAARRLRLDFLHQVRQEQAYDLVALGHTADDQVELFFLRLLRGAGSQGLKGMWPRTPGGLVRPLLAVGKGVVLAWLQQENLPYREDLSNLSRRYLRNRLRLELLPHLQSNYNPRLQAAVWRLMAILQEDERLLAETAVQAFDDVGRWITPDCAALSIPRLLVLSPALTTRLLRQTLGRFLSHQEITSTQVKNMMSLAQGERSGGQIVWENCLVARAGQELHFCRPLPPPPEPHPTLLSGMGMVESPDGWRLQAKELTEPLPDLRPESPAVVRLDKDRVHFPLCLRPLLPGDRFRPAGSQGAKKMQDFLVDAKIPRWLRPYLPLVASGDSIIWVPGLRLAEPVKLTSRSSGVLELTISPATAAATRVWELILAFTRQARDPV